MTSEPTAEAGQRWLTPGVGGIGMASLLADLGAIGGPLLALALVALIGVRGAILASIVPGLLAAAAIVYAIRQIRRPGVGQRQPLRLQLRPVLAAGLGRLLG